MKIFEIIEKANNELNKLDIEDGKLKVKILLSSLLNVKKEYLMINSNEEVLSNTQNDFFTKLELIKKNYPIQYIINKQSFYGYDFFVNENVLIPQPDTEVLVDEVVNYLKELIGNDSNKNVKVIDLCTGSGIIGICIKKALGENVEVFASDISEKALEVASINANNLGVAINYIKSDIFESFSEDFFNKFDLIVSNPPYIRTEVIDTLSDEVKKEPFIALDGKDDGLYFYNKIIDEGRKYLKECGKIFFEIGYDQKEEVMNLFKEYNYKEIYSKKDFSDNDRIVVGMKGE